ncbi:MAG: aminoglycoside phosphotransferase family protein [Alphaproteobacteria bacterium]|nr:aminoglycoside phosphotransferase family protein [Alphaproteobacteria bacterium]
MASSAGLGVEFCGQTPYPLSQSILEFAVQTTLETRCHDLLTHLGRLPSGAVVTVTPLSGGVASDIAIVQVNDDKYCVKFALPKLRVKADWFAPVERNLAEYRWLECVAAIAPQSSVTLLGHSGEAHGFAMEFLDGANTYLFKTALLNGEGKAEEAAAIGTLLGQIHAASTAPDFDTSPFRNHDDFYAIRIEPYLIHTSHAHEDLRSRLLAMADELHQSSAVLIHGDVSPKNIMFRDGRPYILDAECATMGDPSFDLGFCMNHFILKAVHVASCRSRYLSLCRDFWQAYTPHVTWEDLDVLEQRLCRLLPMLMLARVDGKSPVEYFNTEDQALVRGLAIPLIETPPSNLDELLFRLTSTL